MTRDTSASVKWVERKKEAAELPNVTLLQIPTRKESKEKILELFERRDKK